MIDKIVWVSKRIKLTAIISYCAFLVIVIYYVDYFSLMTMIILLPFFIIFYIWSLFFTNIQIRYKINGFFKYFFLVLSISIIVHGTFFFTYLTFESGIMYLLIILGPSISFVLSDYFFFVKRSRHKR
jgi:hypothetical protein